MRLGLVGLGMLALVGCGAGAIGSSDSTDQASQDARRRHHTSATSSASSTAGAAATTGTSGGGTCAGFAEPNTPAPCSCYGGHACSANNCYGGWYCDLSNNRCVAPPSGCGQSSGTTASPGTTGSGSTTTTASSGTTGTTGATTGNGTSGGGVGNQGGSVHLLHFGMTGDTRPPACGQTANYPTPIINQIADAYRAANVQFAVDMGDHMYVCNNDQNAASTQMGMYTQALSRFGGAFFMTQGNHECMGSGSGFCPTGSQNSNHLAFLQALAPVSSTPYYSVDVQTSLGLATFVFVADNSWDSAQQSWLDQTLTTADSRAKYTIISKHHPAGDSSVAANSQIMQVIRSHKFALLLTGHAHYYQHPTADNGRDIIMGTGGAPLRSVSSGAFHGYGIVDQLPSGQLQVTVYDLASSSAHDQWTVGPNQ
jgi:hypothetical protein